MATAILKRQTQHESAPLLPASWSFNYSCSIDGFDAIAELQDEKVFIASNELELVAQGHSFEEACNEFRSLLIDYFGSLVSRQKSLAPNLKAHLEILKSKLPEKNGQE